MKLLKNRSNQMAAIWIHWVVHELANWTYYKRFMQSLLSAALTLPNILLIYFFVPARKSLPHRDFITLFSMNAWHGLMAKATRPLYSIFKIVLITLQVMHTFDCGIQLTMYFNISIQQNTTCDHTLNDNHDNWGWIRGWWMGGVGILPPPSYKTLIKTVTL